MHSFYCTKLNQNTFKNIYIPMCKITMSDTLNRTKMKVIYFCKWSLSDDLVVAKQNVLVSNWYICINQYLYTVITHYATQTLLTFLISAINSKTSQHDAIVQDLCFRTTSKTNSSLKILSKRSILPMKIQIILIFIVVSIDAIHF